MLALVPTTRRRVNGGAFMSLIEGAGSEVCEWSDGASYPDFRRLKIRIGFETRAAFDDLRDAIAAARLMKRDHPTQSVSIVYGATELLVIDFD